MTRRRRVPHSNEALVGESLLRIAAILLRIGIDAPRAEHMLRNAFVLAARDNALASRMRVTQSQIASLAGISRLEVRTILTRSRTERGERSSRYLGRVDQLLQAWKTNPQFLDEYLRPRALTVTGKNNEFGRLVRKYGRDVTPKSLSDQLILRGFAIEEKGKLRLLSDASRDRKPLIENADLRFLASQLRNIDFQIGRRAYVTRRITIATHERKTASLIRRLAVERLNIVLNSIAALSADNEKVDQSRTTKKIRLMVTATVATEAEGQP